MARTRKSRTQNTNAKGVLPDDLYRADTERTEGAIERQGPTITTQSIKVFARTARKRMRTDSGGYRRDYLRGLAQRVEVDAQELRIIGSKSELLRTLVAASTAKRRVLACPVLFRSGAPPAIRGTSDDLPLSRPDQGTATRYFYGGLI
jgi:hypothetical protein